MTWILETYGQAALRELMNVPCEAERELLEELDMDTIGSLSFCLALAKGFVNKGMF